MLQLQSQAKRLRRQWRSSWKKAAGDNGRSSLLPLVGNRTTKPQSPSRNDHDVNHNDNGKLYHKTYKPKRYYQQRLLQRWKGWGIRLGILTCIVLLVKRTCFPLSHTAVKAIDEGVRDFWRRLEEEWHVFDKFPDYDTEYQDEFPEFAILEENHQDIRNEVQAMLDRQRAQIPHLGDLVGKQRSKSTVYKTDWKVFWFKMGSYLESNCAQAPKTAALIRQLPDVTNAFFSILEPHQHIDPHWGHYKGFLRYHMGVIIPHNNQDSNSYLRLRSDLTKNSTMHLAEREVALEQGTKYYWKEGQGVMFDDNPLHDATNESDQVRVVLFLDVPRRPFPLWLNLLNRITIFIFNHVDPIASMRKRAVLPPL